MNFDLDDQQAMLKEAALRYASERCSFHSRVEQTAEGCDRSAPHWGEFAEMGWLTLGVPEALGGLGLSIVEAAIVGEALGRALAIDPFATSAVVCPRALALAPASPLRDGTLADMAERGIRVSLADGSGDGVDPCRRSWRNDKAVISGTVQLVLGAHDADAHLLVVADDLAETPSCELWLVPAGTAGVGFSRYALLDGTQAADLHLDSAELDASHRLMAGPDAMRVLEDALDHGRIAVLADALGSQEACIQLAVEHIKTRQQFGQPIGRFQALQHMVSEMLVEVQAARSMMYRAMAHIDAEPALRAAAVSAAKVVVAGAGTVIGKSAIQLHGACGFTDEYAVSHHYRRQVVGERMLGDTLFHERRLVALRSPGW